MPGGAFPDVSFDVAPASGVAVFDTSSGSVASAWFQVGGTDVGAPVWTALADGAGVRTSAALIYALRSMVCKDITTGANGVGPCVVGYDLLTGRGSPRGPA